MMSPPTNAYEQLLDRLRDDGKIVRATGSNRSIAQCPAHDDRNPSLSITQIEGQALLHCHAGCHVDDILNALGLSPRDLFDDRQGATYVYEDSRKVHRTWDKRFRQSGHLNGHQPTLYRLSKVLAAVAEGRTIWLVEGEKDVHAIEALGEIATTAPMGAANLASCDLTPLYGATVIVVVDRDEAGARWAAEVRKALGGHAQLTFVQAKVGKDAADHIAAGHSLDNLDPWFAPELSDEPQRSSWWPVDLTSVLDGTWAPPEPTIGFRNDGAGLFYPGRDHAIVSESEAGKTWFAVLVCLDEMQAGQHVVYVDFEGDAGGLVNRLLLMGAKRELLAERFHYIRPSERLNADLAETLDTYPPSLTILDGVTEGMVLHGYDPLDNKDIALFGQLLAKRIMTRGPAVVSLDHVTKSSEGRGRYAIGGQHKLAGLDGASYVLTNRNPFGRGLTGKSTIRIAKDRHGQLRANGLPSSEGMHWYGDLVVKIDDHSSYAEVGIEQPHERDENWQPTVLMHKITELLRQKGPLSQRVILGLIKGSRNETIRDALNHLIADGYVGSKTPHALLKPYEEPSE